MSVGSDPNRTLTGLVSWTCGDQNRLIVSGLTSVVEPITTAYIYWGVGQRDEERHPHALGTLITHASIQSSRRTGPSSPPSELLLARVDTGRGVVRSTLRRS